MTQFILSADERALHVAICQAVAILNRTINDDEQRKAHNILRNALDNYGHDNPLECSCHLGSVCTEACKTRHHDGCYKSPGWYENYGKGKSDV